MPCHNNPSSEKRLPQAIESVVRLTFPSMPHTQNQKNVVFNNVVHDKGAVHPLTNPQWIFKQTPHFRLIDQSLNRMPQSRTDSTCSRRIFLRDKRAQPAHVVQRAPGEPEFHLPSRRRQLLIGAPAIKPAHDGITLNPATRLRFGQTLLKRQRIRHIGPGRGLRQPLNQRPGMLLWCLQRGRAHWNHFTTCQWILAPLHSGSSHVITRRGNRECRPPPRAPRTRPSPPGRSRAPCRHRRTPWDCWSGI